MSIPTGPLYLPYYGFPWPVPGKESGSEANDDLSRLVGKQGHLKNSGLPYKVVAVAPNEKKVQIKIGRLHSDWLTIEELRAASREDVTVA